MKSARNIRAATLEDGESLRRCMASAYRPYQDRMSGIRLPPLDVDYRSEIKNFPTWVVESAGKIIGGLIVFFEADYATIANIAIDPKFQGQGVGGELLGFAEMKAREKGLCELRLATHILLEENISLYCYLGWRETGRDKTRVFMKKAI